MKLKTVGHVLHCEATPGALPPLTGRLFDYVLTADGLYVHGKRQGLEVCFPVILQEVRELAPVEEMIYFDLPRVPQSLVQEILTVSTDFARHGLETLFYLIHSRVYPWNRGWELVMPKQNRTAMSCQALDTGPDSDYSKAIIEVHSHHLMRARFSHADDMDERGFRLYGVVGRLGTKPEIRLRVGMYGYFHEIPARRAMELPAGLNCCVEIESEAKEKTDLCKDKE